MAAKQTEPQTFRFADDGSIPNNPALAGIYYFNQAIAGDPAANALGATLSNATSMVTGN